MTETKSENFTETAPNENDDDDDDEQTDDNSDKQQRQIASARTAKTVKGLGESRSRTELPLPNRDLEQPCHVEEACLSRGGRGKNFFQFSFVPNMFPSSSQ
jgi:hypothetical protein